MKVVKATTAIEKIEGLKEVALEWRDTCINDFGIELVLEVHFKDLAGLIEDENSELFLLMKNDKVVGYMGAVCFDSPTGNQIMTQEHCWFVRGKSRGRGILLLLRAIEKWAKEKGCSHRIMTASCLASDMHDRLCKFYEKIGFKKFETSFIKEIT